MKTAREHIDWCKSRAREYLAQGDVANAVASMRSDLQKHPDTKQNGGVLTMLGLHAAASGDVETARRYIEGF